MNIPNTAQVAVTSTAIAEYSPTAAALADLAKRMAKVVYDVSTPEGMAAARADRAEVKALRVALEHKRKEIKAPALARCDEVDIEAKRITAELLKYETPPDEAIKAHEAKVEAARQALVKAEQDRVAAIHARIAEFRGAVEIVIRHSPMPSAQIAEHITDLKKIALDDSFQEYKGNAEIEMADTLRRLEEFRQAAVNREAEAARLAEERAALDRDRLAQEERNRVERERIQAEEKVAREKREADAAVERQLLDQQRAEQDAQAANIRREREALEAAQRAEQECKDAAVRAAETARQEAAAKAQRETEEEAERHRLASFIPETSEMVAVLMVHYKRDAPTIIGWLRTAFGDTRKAA